MTPTPERLEVLDMIKYWAAGSSLMFQQGQPAEAEHDGRRSTLCGHKIAVMTGTTQAENYLPLISEDCAAEGQAGREGGGAANVRVR